MTTKKPRVVDHRDVDDSESKKRHGTDRGAFAKVLISHNVAVNDPSTVAGGLRAWHHVACILLSVAVPALHYSEVEAPWATKMLLLSHPVEGKAGTYITGPDDVSFLLYWSIVFTALRWIFSAFFLSPVGKYVLGVETEKQGKFNDQGWQGLYYLVAWCCGQHLMFGTAWGQQALSFDSTGLFQDYPIGHIELTTGFKCYYLLQAAFWVHQLLVLYIEEWRKDVGMYLFHHLITIFLVVSSYYFNATRVGTAVLVEQDFADIFLPIALMFKYAHQETLCEVFFGIFALTWIPTRHGIFFWIYNCIWNLYNPEWNLNIQPYDPAAGAHMSATVQTVYLVALGIFQCLLCLWLKELLAGIYNAVMGGGAEEEEEEEKPKKK